MTLNQTFTSKSQRNNIHIKYQTSYQPPMNQPPWDS